MQSRFVFYKLFAVMPYSVCQKYEIRLEEAK